MKHVGEFILEVLKEKNMSLRALAREAGVSNAYLSQLSRGLFKPTPEILLRLAPHLGATAEKMFQEAGWLEPETTKKAKAKGK